MTRLGRLAAVAAAVTALGAAGCATTSSGSAAPVAGAPPPAAPSGAVHHHHDQGGSAAPVRSGEPAGRLVVHADDQVRAPLGFLVERFQEAYPAIDVVVDFGTSTEHARHILGGAVADVFVSGDAAATAQVVEHHGARADAEVIARNPLVIAERRTATRLTSLADLRRPGVRLAVCAQHTPCGDAARLISGLPPATVRADGAAAVAAVRSGSADAALVHRTDIVGAKADLKTVDFPEGVAHADQFAVVRLRAGGNRVAADAFLALTESALAKRVLADAGLTPA